MKKIFSAVILFLYIGSVSLTAFGASAEETAVPAVTEISEADEYVGGAADEKIVTYKTMGDLYQLWGMEGYPDYVCGVWSNDGTMDSLTVAVTKDEKGETGKKEILSLIENHESVDFTYMTYSYNELRQVQRGVEEILMRETDAGNLNSWGVGVYEMQNIVHADIYGEDDVIKSIMEECFKLYRDMVSFETMSGPITWATAEFGPVPAGGADGYSSGGKISAGGKNDDTLEWSPETTGDEPSEGETGAVTAISVTTAENKSDNLIIYMVCAAAVIIIAGVGIFSFRKAKIRVASAGNITEGVKLNRSQVEAMLKTEEVPDRDILADVMKEIDG